ncbi:MAG TPA: hypothetical protein VEM36_08980 [Xanthobacteraceae bacterium]|nr:hypothetical protein [Xanthobacteraceae bacterium]
MSTDDKSALEHEFDVMLARAGIAVPPDRRAGVMGGCHEMRRFAAVIRREPLPATSEPSNVFSLKPYVRTD